MELRRYCVAAALAIPALMACGGGGLDVFGVQTNVVPPPAGSRFTESLVERGEITRTAPDAFRVRLPVVRLEETAGFGGRFEGWGIDVGYYDATGTLRRFEVPRPSELAYRLFGERYEGHGSVLLRVNQPLDLVFVGSPHDPESVAKPRPNDWLAYLRWFMVIRDDVGAEASWMVICPPDWFEFGPGAR